MITERLTRTEERDLFAAGNLNAVVESHLDFVKGLANKYAGNDLSLFDDLVQVGCLGLIRAAGLFDPGLGLRFMTYAKWWVRQEMGNYKFTMHRIAHVGRSPEVVKARSLIIDGMTDVNELSKQIGASLSKTERLLALFSRTDMCDTLTQERDEYGGTFETRAEYLRSTSNPEADVLQAHDVAAIALALAKLTPREADIVRRHVMADEPETLETIGRDHNITRQWVQQIEKKALEKIGRSLREADTNMSGGGR